jgi:hypothetical protein
MQVKSDRYVGQKTTASPRTKRAQPSGSEDSYFTVLVCSPNDSSTIVEASAGLFGATYTGTNAGSVAGV